MGLTTRWGPEPAGADRTRPRGGGALAALKEERGGVIRGGVVVGDVVFGRNWWR